MSSPVSEAATEPTCAQSQLAPMSDRQRIALVDAIRGVAVLGILLMNIPVFAMSSYFAESFKSDPTNVNFWIDAVISIAFEGKMRALFGMMFGAGVVLFVSTKEQAGRSVTRLYYRRMLWLILFGLIHAHLILWIGDILYLYGVCGVIVYLMRNVSPKLLVLAVPLVAVIDFTTGTIFYQQVRQTRLAYVDAVRLQHQGIELNNAQKKALSNWRDLEETIIPSREDDAENTRKMKSDYSSVAAVLRPLAFYGQTILLPFSIWDSLALMLLGLALFRWGFLTGRWTSHSYLLTLAIGYIVGQPMAVYIFYDGYAHSPNLEASLARLEAEPIEWVNLLYPFQRIFLVMAHVSAIVLASHCGYATSAFKRLAAVGQMALTNYVVQSLVCTWFFFGYGLNYFDELQYYQLSLVVLVIWFFQLWFSPLWLKYFLFGPLEWLWRSLTYWQLQPILRR